ncbi:MAG: hypothetical protein RL434_231 [Pseudomonadota bacterium]|jgi:hypothetical protein
MSNVNLDLSKMLGFKILVKDSQPLENIRNRDVRLEAKVGEKAGAPQQAARLGSKVGGKADAPSQAARLGGKIGGKVGTKPV